MDALDIMEKVIRALEHASGIKQSFPNMAEGKISFIPQEKDFAELQRLYKDQNARPFIDKFFEIGKIDKAKFGLGT